LEACASVFVKHAARYKPQPDAVKAYRGLYEIYRQIYPQTRELNERLAAYRG
jgi:xylulokinase